MLNAIGINVHIRGNTNVRVSDHRDADFVSLRVAGENTDVVFFLHADRESRDFVESLEKAVSEAKTLIMENSECITAESTT